VVELEAAQIRGVEVVAANVGVIATPERLLEFAVPGRVQCHQAVVILARNRADVMVQRRKYEASWQQPLATCREVGTIADMRMRLHRIRHLRGSFGGQIGERAGADSQGVDRMMDQIVSQTACVVGSGTNQQVGHGTAAMRSRHGGQRRNASRIGQAMEIARDQGAAVKTTHRVSDDMDDTFGIFLLNGIRECSCPILEGPDRWYLGKQGSVLPCRCEVGFQAAEVIDSENTLRDQKAACEYEIQARSSFEMRVMPGCVRGNRRALCYAT
jgi:hypothetical protein